MKIAAIGSGWFPTDPGGLERYFYGLTHELARQGDYVEAFTAGKPESDLPNYVARGIVDDGVRQPLRALRAARTFQTHLAKNFDVLNIHFAPYAVSALPFRRKGTPTVCTFHGPWAEESRAEGAGRFSVAAKYWVERLAYAGAVRFVTLTEAFKAILVRSYRVDPGQVTVIPPGIDPALLLATASRSEARSRLSWPQDRFVVFAARRLVARVGISQLIDAAAIVRARGGDFWLAVAGRGPLRDALESRLREADLAEHVRLLGFISEEDLSLAYAAADVTIVPSQSLEGFGFTIPESLAAGTPVLVTPVGGMPEAVRALSPQAVLDGIGAEAIASGLLDVMSGRLLLPDSGACRRFVADNYVWPTIAGRVREVFVAAA